ncbi:MAG: cob(I)yrinic acid a,c-diamide adenosyltransferase [Candidatus Aenigmatarchaeota archaeon]
MAIYTKTGDDGQTSTCTGRTSKNSCLIEASGTIDELSSVIGATMAEVKHEDIDSLLAKIQNELQIICAELSSIGDYRIKEDRTKYLEEMCDKYENELEPLTKFILPGGSKGGSLMHLSRTVARRAERVLVKLSEEARMNRETLKYLNRLSDLLFILARVVNKRDGITEKNPEY